MVLKNKNTHAKVDKLSRSILRQLRHAPARTVRARIHDERGMEYIFFY